MEAGGGKRGKAREGGKEGGGRSGPPPVHRPSPRREPGWRRTMRMPGRP